MKVVRVNPECGCEYEALYIDDKLFVEGDYYHDKIRQHIDGILKGIQLFENIEVEVDNSKNCPYCN